MAFDPYAPAPPELETGMIKTPLHNLGPAIEGTIPALLGTFSGTGAPAPTIVGLPEQQSPPPLPAGPPPGALAPQPAPMPAPVPAPAPRPRVGGGGGLGAPAPAPAPDTIGKDLAAAGQQGLTGIQNVQEAKAAGGEALSRAQGDLSVEQRSQAQELKDTADRNRRLTAHLDQQDADNLKKARDYTIPDFWKGHEGARVGSIIAIAMGGIASGVLGGPNGALQIINKQVDDYFHKQKEKVDNLYKYAEQTGRLNDKTRLQYAQELTNMAAQHNAVNQSILTRIESVKSKNAANVDMASTDSLEAALRTKIAEGADQHKALAAHVANETLNAQENVRHNKASESLQRQQIAASREQKTNKSDDSLIYDANGRPFAQAQTPAAAQKFRDQQVALADLGKAIGELEQNYSKGATLPGGLTETGRERDAIMSRITLAAKTVGQLGALSGPDLQLVQDLAGGNVGKYLGNTAGIGNLKRLHQTGMQTALSQVGAAPSPENMQRFVAPGTPQGGGNPPIGTRATSGGKPIVMTASGWQFAQ